MAPQLPPYLNFPPLRMRNYRDAEGEVRNGHAVNPILSTR